MRAPRIMIAAPGSGSGKTLLTCALLAALKKREKDPAAFKCGPDYIDPMFHKKVLGVPSKNLDTFFTGEETTRYLFLESAGEQKTSVIEGVMGLYDGLGGIREEGSSYHLACVLQTPVILVLDAHGMGRSILAVIAGFLQYDTAHLIKGVILNRTSKMFYETIRPEIERAFPIQVLGYFPKQQDLQFESRHLGLKMPQEIFDIREKTDRAAEILEETVAVDAIEKLAESAKELSSSYQSPMFRLKEKVKVAVAWDEAFCFYYEDNLKLLQKMGAELLYFSPLHDKEVPEDASAILLGGGYPELYAAELSQNTQMLASVKKCILQGVPTVAECGGFLYLHETMEDMQNHTYRMAGVLPGHCRYAGKLVRFGYIELIEKETEFLKEGDRIRGHEFHYYDSEQNGTACLAEKPVSKRGWECVVKQNGGWFGFPHLYYYSNPAYAEQFLKKAADYQNRA